MEEDRCILSVNRHYIYIPKTDNLWDFLCLVFGTATLIIKAVCKICVILAIAKNIDPSLAFSLFRMTALRKENGF